MTMQDWSQRLNRFLEFNEHEILLDTGRVTHEIAKAFAESEFEKYGVVIRIGCLKATLTVFLPWRKWKRIRKISNLNRCYGGKCLLREGRILDTERKMISNSRELEFAVFCFLY